MNNKQTHKRRGRGIYLLPNLFTVGGIFAGFYAIIAAMKGYFELAAQAIFIAMIMDSLDGRVARMTNTESDFGMELDSLADLVSFGVAPALVVYSWSLMNLGKPGWLAAFLYMATVALRLARFNTQAASTDKKYFQGLPCPAGAGVIASLVWIGTQYAWIGKPVAAAISVVTILVGLLMVSNIRFNSFKQIDLRGKVSFYAILAIVLLFVAISYNPPHVLFIGFSLYALSGPIMTLRGLREKRLKRKTRGRFKKRGKKDK